MEYVNFEICEYGKKWIQKYVNIEIYTCKGKSKTTFFIYGKICKV